VEIWLERGEPLWLDEAWTVGIAAPMRWIDFFHQVYWDVNAPLYYLLMHLWQAVFGQSDLAMHAPSLIFAVVTPLAILAGRDLGLTHAEKLSWAALSAVWFPVLCYAQEARCYALLFFFSTLQAIAFLRLLRSPSTARALVWATFGALAILTHYDALFIGAIQGLIYLGVHRAKAVRTWPAALAFVPAFAWLGYHAPRIAEFARPDIAWYSPIDFDDLPDILTALPGGDRQCWVLLGGAILALGLRFIPWLPRRRDPFPGWAPWLTTFAALLSAAVLVAIGFFRPSFAPRYLTPDGPGLILGLVLVGRLLAGRRTSLALCVFCLAFALAGLREIAVGERMAPKGYNYERASQILEKVHPQHVVFLWDHPVDPIEHPEQLDAAGGAFFRRDGLHVTVDPVILKPGEDPNKRLLTGATGPHSVILWVYDIDVHGTAAVMFPPRITELDPRWTCRHTRGGRAVVACWRKDEAQ
jgi:hypothetical protein